MIRYAFFDLDDTLYNAQCGLWAAIGARIDRYMVERLGLPPETTLAQRRHYLEQYGTTLNGLRREHEVDADDFLAFVHDVPLAQYLGPSAELNAMLTRLPQTKAIFTNADAPHAQRVLACLGIAHHFSHIIDIHALGFVNKPHPAAYQHALRVVGASPQDSVFADDALRNLRPAHALGMLTVLVAPGDGPPPEGADYRIGSVLELEGVLGAVNGVRGAQHA